MKILICTPSLEPYGGVRVIVNWAKYLSRTHSVTVASHSGAPSTNWIKLPEKVNFVQGWASYLGNFDVVIGTNPDTMRYLLDRKSVIKRLIYLCQMAEEMFLPDSHRWVVNALDAAIEAPEMITVAEWITEHYHQRWRSNPTYVVPNGVDEEFGFDLTQKEVEPTILVEGWEGNNAVKDTEGIAADVAKFLKEKHGFKVLAYGQQPIKRHQSVVDEYYQQASTKTLVSLYNRAWYFLKASKFETRSLAPLEAMACGCIPIVGITQGHPDVLHQYNGIRADYNYTDLLEKTLFLLNSDRKAQLQVNGIRYVQERCNWSDIINKMVKPLLEA